MAKIFSLFGEIYVDNSKLNSSLNDSNKAGENFAKSFGKTCTSIGTAFAGVSAAAGVALGASTKSAITFEDSMAKVSTIMDTSKVSYADMQQAILDLSNQTGISANDIADNVYNAISAGQDTADAINFVTESTKLAKAGFTDSAKSLDLLTTIENAYNLEASETNRISDMLIQTQNKGKLTIDDLSSSMGKVIPTANANAVSLDQLCASYALMTANGVATAESTTYLNSLLNELGKSSSISAGILKEKTGKSFKELMEEGYSLSDVLNIVNDSAIEDGKAFGDMFGSAEGAKAGLILLKGEGEDFNNMLGSMNESTGATDEAFEKLQTTSNTLAKMWNRVKNAGIELGAVIVDMLQPYLEKLSVAVEGVTQWFSSLSDDTKKLIAQLLMVVTAIAPVLLAVGKFSTMLATASANGGALAGAITKFIGICGGGAGALGMIGLAIGAVVVFVQALKNNWDLVCDTFTRIYTEIQPSLELFFGAVQGFINALMPTIQTIIDSIMNIANACIPLIMSVLEALSPILSGMIGILTDLFNNILTPAITILGTVAEYIGNVIVNAINLATPVITFLAQCFSLAFSSIQLIVGTVVNVIGGIFNSILIPSFNTVMSVLNVLNGVFTTVFSAIQQAVLVPLGTVANWISGVFVGALNGLRSVVGGITGWFSSAFGSIAGIVRAPINAVIGIINGFISGLNRLKIPEWIPLIGGAGVNIPLLPKLKVGMDYVPYDEMPALLHKGERVLTADENREYADTQRTQSTKEKAQEVINNYFTIQNMSVKSDSDIKKIAEELYYLQRKAVI